MHPIRLASCSALAFLMAQLPAQDPPKPEPPRAAPARLVAAPAPMPLSQDELKTRRTEKLAKPVFQKAAWLTDYDAARAEAKKSGKLILTYFTRSYAG